MAKVISIIAARAKKAQASVSNDDEIALRFAEYVASVPPERRESVLGTMLSTLSQRLKAANGGVK